MNAKLCSRVERSITAIDALSVEKRNEAFLDACRMTESSKAIGAKLGTYTQCVDMMRNPSAHVAASILLWHAIKAKECLSSIAELSTRNNTFKPIGKHYAEFALNSIKVERELNDMIVALLDDAA